jgi:hypothetical protein
MTPASATGFLASAMIRSSGESLRWMPHLPERVIGRVSGVIDGALIDESQTARDFFWRSLDLYAADNLRRVSRAAFLVLDVDFEVTG